MCNYTCKTSTTNYTSPQKKGCDIITLLLWIYTLIPISFQDTLYKRQDKIVLITYPNFFVGGSKKLLVLSKNTHILNLRKCNCELPEVHRFRTIPALFSITRIHQKLQQGHNNNVRAPGSLYGKKTATIIRLLDL